MGLVYKGRVCFLRSYFWLSAIPSWMSQPTSVTYKEGIYVGYRYFNTFALKPSYEFGYGLSYTSFDISNLKLSALTFFNKMTIILTVRNTGKTAGKEVVQLYLSAPSKNTDKPS